MTEEKLMKKLSDEIEKQMNEANDASTSELPDSSELKEKLMVLMIATDKAHEQKLFDMAEYYETKKMTHQ